MKIIKSIAILLLAAFALMTCKQSKKNNSTAMTQDEQIMRDSITGYSPVNGIKMYYEIHGEGKPLVLIHGGGSTIQTSFGRLIPELSKNHRVIAVELQAHGRTSDRDAPESFEQDADDVATLLHNLNISKASFFGFSNGGNTAMQIAIRHSEIVDKLIIASAFYKKEGLPPGFFEGMKTATLDVMPDILKTAFLEINPDSSLLQNMFDKDRERMANFKDWDDDVLRSIKAPSLIISGDEDIILPAHAVTMSQLIPNSRLAILPANHGSYMATGESGYTDWKMIKATLGIVEAFLDSEDKGTY